MRLTHSEKGTVIECGGPLAEKYLASGWVLVEQAKPAAEGEPDAAEDGAASDEQAKPAARRGRPKKSD